MLLWKEPPFFLPPVSLLVVIDPICIIKRIRKFEWQSDWPFHPANFLHLKKWKVLVHRLTIDQLWAHCEIPGDMGVRLGCGWGGEGYNSFWSMNIQWSMPFHLRYHDLIGEVWEKFCTDIQLDFEFP